MLSIPTLAAKLGIKYIRKPTITITMLLNNNDLNTGLSRSPEVLALPIPYISIGKRLYVIHEAKITMGRSLNKYA